jgi:C4-dicarboxylate-binding protein DctP
VRGQLATILAEVTTERNAASTAVDEEAKASILAAGGIVRTLNAEQRAAWVEAMKPVWAQFEGDIGADLIQAATAFNPTN